MRRVRSPVLPTANTWVVNRFSGATIRRVRVNQMTAMTRSDVTSVDRPAIARVVRPMAEIRRGVSDRKRSGWPPARVGKNP